LHSVEEDSQQTPELWGARSLLRPAAGGDRRRAAASPIPMEGLSELQQMLAKRKITDG
jgi:hypothetical protein